jgi:hypothetical protein
LYYHNKNTLSFLLEKSTHFGPFLHRYRFSSVRPAVRFRLPFFFFSYFLLFLPRSHFTLLAPFLSSPPPRRFCTIGTAASKQYLKPRQISATYNCN